MTCFKKKRFTMKKGYYCFFQNFQLVISLYVLKLALNKRMCASDTEQGFNKLQSYNGQCL